MKIVVDTSVFISGIMSANGAAREVLRHCLLGQCQPVMGQALFAEYESVLGRKDLFEKSMISPQERIELFHAFLSTCQWVHIYYLWRPNLLDEADNHVVELALAGGATSVVTHNIKDFNRSELQFQFEVLTPGQLISKVS